MNRDGLLVAARHCAPGISLLFVGRAGVVSFAVVVSILFIVEWTGGAAFDHDVAQE